MLTQQEFVLWGDTGCWVEEECWRVLESDDGGDRGSMIFIQQCTYHSNNNQQPMDNERSKGLLLLQVRTMRLKLRLLASALLLSLETTA